MSKFKMVLIAKKRSRKIFTIFLAGHQDFLEGDPRRRQNWRMNAHSASATENEILINRILGNLFLNQGLVEEISLLVHPVIVGNKSHAMFTDIEKNLGVQLVKSECLEKQYVCLVYQAKKK